MQFEIAGDNTNALLMKRRRPEISASLRKKFVPPKRKNASENSSNRPSNTESESSGGEASRPSLVSQPVQISTPREKQFHDNPLRSRKRPLVATSSTSSTDKIPTVTGSDAMNTNNRLMYSMKNPYAKSSHGFPSSSSKALRIPGRNTATGNEATKRFHTTNINTPVQQPKPQSSVVLASTSASSSRTPTSIWNPYKKTYQFVRSSTSASTSSRNANGPKVTENKNPYINKKTPVRNPYLKNSRGHQQQKDKEQWKEREVNQSKAAGRRIDYVSKEAGSLQVTRMTPHSNSLSHTEKDSLVTHSNTSQLQPQPHPTSWKSPSVQTITISKNAKESKRNHIEVIKSDVYSSIKTPSHKAQRPDGELEQRSQSFSLAGSYTLEQSEKFLKPQSEKRKHHSLEFSSSSSKLEKNDTRCEHLALHQGLSNPSISFRPILHFHNDVEKDTSNGMVHHARSLTCEGEGIIHELKRILPITHASQKDMAKSESVGIQSVNQKELLVRHDTKEKEPIGARTPIVKVSGRSLLVGKRPFVRPVSRQKKYPIAKLEAINRPANSRPYQKRRLFQENETQSHSQPSPQALRRPYPYVPAPQAWLQGITKNMMQPSHKCSSKSCFLLDAIKEAKMRNTIAHQKLSVGEGNTEIIAYREVRIMGYVTSTPEMIIADSTLPSQYHDRELLTFMFDDGTFQIDALVDGNSSEELRNRQAKISNRIDCIGYIHYTYHTRSSKGQLGAMTATPVFIIQSLKYVDDPSLETFRMMQILTQSKNHATRSPTIRNDIFIQNDGNRVTCNLPSLHRYIKESKPDGLSEEDLTLLFDVKNGSREKNAMLIGLKKLQMDLKIYQTKSGRYLTM